MKIEKLKKTSNGKYKVYLDNDEVVTTYDEVILKNNLLFHKEVDSNLLNELSRDNSYYDVALDLIKSEKEFYIRAGLIIMLDHYVDDTHIQDILKQVDRINTDVYYVNMARAWLISICFIKYREETLDYLKNNNLDKFTFNKAISKMCDSYRVSLEDKEMLKLLRG